MKIGGNDFLKRTSVAVLAVWSLLALGAQGGRTNSTHKEQRPQYENLDKVQEGSYEFQNPYPPISAAASSGDGNSDYFASYDTDYIGPATKTNISAFLYDTDAGNADIFPNPEMMVYDNMDDGGRMAMFTDPLQLGIFNNIKLPDNSLADADLKDHNLIDSVNYVYGIANAPSTKKEWMFIVLMTRIMAIAITAITLLGVLFAGMFEKFRKRSKMYPLELNLLCSLLMCNVVYLAAIIDTKSCARCEMVAILLHYSHIVCCAWLLMQCKATANWANDLGYNPDIKCSYLFTYGMPAILVLVFYSLSMEKYETSFYCWMSVENGMLIGCMLPVCVFIISNTIFAIVGQRSLSRKKTEIITSKIHEMLNQDMTSGVAMAPILQDDKHLDDISVSGMECLEEMHDLNQPRTSQTDSIGMPLQTGTSDMVDVNLAVGQSSTAKSSMNVAKIDLTSLSLDNLSWKSATTEEVDSLKSFLTFSLILQPLFCVSWFMGVIALENCNHWLTPSVFLLLSCFMYIFIAVHFFTVMPIICDDFVDIECGEKTENSEIQNASRQQPTPSQQRSMDNIPLLVSNVTPSTAPVIPADAISTISI